ncbi:MAG: hypothetical protein U0Q18_32770 [Bryobacteraceae bacterium]
MLNITFAGLTAGKGVEAYEVQICSPGTVAMGAAAESTIVRGNRFRRDMMSSRQNEYDGLIARVRGHNEHRALQQAKRVCWKTLAAAADEYTKWVALALWLRAVVDAAGGIRPEVAQDLESRVPLAFERIRLDFEVAVQRGESPGARVWQALLEWAEKNTFVGPKRAGWLDSVRYFSSCSLDSIKAWSYWESIDKEWRSTPPDEFPTYTQWQFEVARVARVPDDDGLSQQILTAVKSLPVLEWTKHLTRYSDLIVFLLWMELMLEVQGRSSPAVESELRKRYCGFRLSSSSGPKDTVRALHEWVIDGDLGGAGKKSLVPALSFHVMYHPAYPAMRGYAQHCHSLWLNEQPDPLPSFEAWRADADGYFERSPFVGGSHSPPGSR